MCVSRWNPSEPCCGDVNKCATCPQINWERYTYTISLPQTDLERVAVEIPEFGSTYWRNARFRKLEHEPLYQLGPCSWMQWGILEGATSYHPRYRHHSIDDVMDVARSAKPWASGFDPIGTPSYWQDGVYYGHSERGRVFFDAVDKLVAEWQQRLDDGEDLPEIPSELSNPRFRYLHAFNVGYLYTGIFNSQASLAFADEWKIWNGWSWSWSPGFGTGWGGGNSWAYGYYFHPGFASVGFSEGSWHLALSAVFVEQYQFSAIIDYHPIAAKDWNCYGKNTFKLKTASEFMPAEVDVEARRIEPELPYTYAWEIDDSAGFANNILHIHGVL